MHTDTNTDTQTHTHTHRQTDRQTDRQTHRQTHTQTHTHLSVMRASGIWLSMARKDHTRKSPRGTDTSTSCMTAEKRNTTTCAWRRVHPMAMRGR